MLLLLGGYEIPSGVPTAGAVPLNPSVCYHSSHANFLTMVPFRHVDSFLYTLAVIHIPRVQVTYLEGQFSIRGQLLCIGLEKKERNVVSIRKSDTMSGKKLHLGILKIHLLLFFFLHECEWLACS